MQLKVYLQRKIKELDRVQQISWRAKEKLKYGD